MAEACRQGGIVLPELKKITGITAVAMVAGALLGLILGALTEEYLLWIGIGAALGVGFGLTLSYGFLPES
jgi:hypothetical protein